MAPGQTQARDCLSTPNQQESAQSPCPVDCLLLPLAPGALLPLAYLHTILSWSSRASSKMEPTSNKERVSPGQSAGPREDAGGRGSLVPVPPSVCTPGLALIQAGCLRPSVETRLQVREPRQSVYSLLPAKRLPLCSNKDPCFISDTRNLRGKRCQIFCFFFSLSLSLTFSSFNFLKDTALAGQDPRKDGARRILWEGGVRN